MQHIVKCRICKEEFDTNSGIEWVMPSKNWYYHKSCFDDFGKKKEKVTTEADAELWMVASWRLLHNEYRIDLDYYKFQGQWNSYIAKKMTPKGIYFTLRYFYDIKKGDGSRADGGIGIVPYIYDDSVKYWVNRNRIEVDIVKKIEDQVRQMEARETIVVVKTKKGKRKMVNLDEVVKMEEENG